MITKQTDICVVAAGPSGLAAAISAREAGANVIVLERTRISGGAANMGMGLFAVETRHTKEAMSNLTVADAFRKFMDYTHYRCDARLVREYLGRSGDTIRWLEGMGIQFAAAVKYFPSSEATWHLVAPPEGVKRKGHAAVMIEKMTEYAKKLGVEFFFETPATRLELTDGRISGVIGENKAGEAVRISCDAAILCTGGFGGDKKQIEEKLGLRWGDDISSITLPFSQGDGIRMALEVGAASEPSNIEIMYTKPGRPAAVTQCLWRQPKALILNEKCDRVFNEELLENTTYTGNIILQQPHRRVFSIIDTNALQYYQTYGRDLHSNVFEDIDSEEFVVKVEADLKQEIPGLYHANSVKGLAQALGVDYSALKRAIDTYNEGCARGDDYFFKRKTHLLPLTGPDYYAMTFVPGGYGTLGGIRIDHKTQVLDAQWEAIPGLYAAGTDACNIFGDSYVFILPGNTMGFCVNSGRIAGEHAVEYLGSRRTPPKLTL